MGSLLERRMLVDFSHVVYRNFFMSRRQIDSLNAENPGNGFFYLKFLLYQSLFYITEKFSPSEVVLAIDGEKNWRKKFYNEYKANRKEKRDKDDFDWETFFDDLKKFTNEIKENFPFKIIGNEYLEADDVAGWFARTKNDVETIMITSDKDWTQLLKYKNIKMWDPVDKKYINLEDPEGDLKIKILMGDRGDNVPPIRRGIGIKTAIKILADEERYKEETQKYRKELKRNSVLIDLKYTPSNLLERLEKSYQTYEIQIKNLSHLYGYFSKMKMSKMCDRLTSISKTLSSIDF